MSDSTLTRKIKGSDLFTPGINAVATSKDSRIKVTPPTTVVDYDECENEPTIIVRKRLKRSAFFCLNGREYWVNKWGVTAIWSDVTQQFDHFDDGREWRNKDEQESARFAVLRIATSRTYCNNGESLHTFN